MPDSDSNLVLRTLNGDKSAFGQLYDRYARLIRAICRDSTADLSVAQDLAQECFLRAYAKLGELKEPGSFGPWLISIARNVGREHIRSKSRDRHVLAGESTEEFVDEKSEEQNDRLGYLSEAMQQLDEQERLALHVYYLQGEDVDEVKRLLNVSRSGLYRLLARGREKIEKFIKQKENQ